MLLRLLAPLVTLAVAALASPIEKGAQHKVLDERSQYGTAGEGDHFAAILALQLLGRGALNATATADGQCAEECSAWLAAVEPCPRNNTSVAVACACGTERLKALQGCASCLGVEAEMQAGAFASICPASATRSASITFSIGSVSTSSVAQSSPSKSLASTPSRTSLTASTAPSPSNTSGSTPLFEGKAILLSAAVAVVLAILTL